MAQTSYSNFPAVGRAGEKASTSQGDKVEAAIADGTVQVGILGMFGDVHNEAGDLNPGEFKPIPALTVDADAIIEAHATATSAQSISGEDLDGVVGGNKMVPARRITLTANSHADWNLTTILVHGLDVDGKEIQEALLMPDAGNTVLTTKQYFSLVVQVDVPAQGGTNGSYTVGYTADEGQFSGMDCGFALREPAGEPLTSDSFADGDALNVLRIGEMFAVSEAAASKGDPVYVRMVASGADVRGQLSSVPGAGFSALKDCYWATSCDADGVGVVKKMK